MTPIAVAYWRDIATGLIYREETYADGTVANERPSSGAADATEQDYYVSQGAGNAGTQAWTQAGIEANQ